jgi:heavy metal translocating P-type ATPase
VGPRHSAAVTKVGGRGEWPEKLPAPQWFSRFLSPEFLARGDTAIAVLAALGIITHLLLAYILHGSPSLQLVPLKLVAGVGGGLLILQLLQKTLRAEFGSDLLAGLSIAVAAAMSQYLVAAIVVLMLSGGTALEQFAARRASSVLEALAKRMPSMAHRKSAEGVSEIASADIVIGDLLVVFPHEICPVDGVVIDGRGKMDEAYLTGEPFETSKLPGSEVLSGAINGESALTIQAGKLPVDSRYSKIMQVMHATQQSRPRLRRLGDMLGAWYTPFAVLLAAVAALVSGQPQRFLAVLVIATPCPLLLAIPVAVIGAISLAARRSIIIKNPAALERIGRCTTLIFDKTGTLTYGRPKLTEILCAPGATTENVLRLAASLERYSKHPLAGAIVSAAQSSGLPLEGVTQVSERPGEGLRGEVAGMDVWICGRDSAGDGVILPEQTKGLECLVFVNGSYAGTFRFHDVPRAEGRKFVDHLGRRHQVDRILVVSGDRAVEVKYLAELLGIRNTYASASPEEKIIIVRAETARANTLFIGDGINDAPAMQAATVGVAFGMHSDITAEAADAVILEPSLDKIDELIHIGRRMRSIALWSAIGGMSLSVIGMVAAAFGLLAPIAGAMAQEAIDLVVVLNALRAAAPFDQMTDF